MLAIRISFVVSICALPIFSDNQPSYLYMVEMMKGLFLKNQPGPGAPPADRYKFLHGEEVTPHSYPFQVLILSFIQNGSSSDSSVCGGSLISQMTILTAAHCSKGAVSSLALLGVHNIDYKYERNRMSCVVKKWIPHEAYDGANHINDIAIVKLVDMDVAFDLHKYHGFVHLPDKQLALEGKEGLALGWGDVEEKELAGPLRSGKVKIEVRDSCPVNTGNKLVLCGYGKGESRPCYADIGGPLVVEDMLVGIASYGDAKCEEGSPVVYTRVDKYLEWISKNGNPVAAVLLWTLPFGLMMHLLI